MRLRWLRLVLIGWLRLVVVVLLGHGAPLLLVAEHAALALDDGTADGKSRLARQTISDTALVPLCPPTFLPKVSQVNPYLCRE